MKQARETARLSQEELAERVDLTRLTIARYESGRLKPSFERLLPIANAVSRPLWWFFVDDEENPTPLAQGTNDKILQEILGRLAQLEQQVHQCRDVLTVLANTRID